MRKLVIDGARMTSKEAVYAQLNRVFSFPTYFGNNLDALWDVLLEESEPTAIHFKNVDFMLEQMGRYGEKLLKVFENLEAMNRHYEVCFYPNEIEE